MKHKKVLVKIILVLILIIGSTITCLIITTPTSPTDKSGCVKLVDKPDLRVEKIYSGYRMVMIKLTSSKKLEILYPYAGWGETRMYGAYVDSVNGNFSGGMYMYVADNVPDDDYYHDDYVELGVPLIEYKFFVPIWYSYKGNIIPRLPGGIIFSTKNPHEMYLLISFIRHGDYKVLVRDDVKCENYEKNGLGCTYYSSEYKYPYPVIRDFSVDTTYPAIYLDASPFYRNKNKGVMYYSQDLLEDFTYDVQSKCSGSFTMNDYESSYYFSKQLPSFCTFRFPGSGSNGSSSRKLPFFTLAYVVRTLDDYLYNFFLYDYEGMPSYEEIYLNESFIKTRFGIDYREHFSGHIRDSISLSTNVYTIGEPEFYKLEKVLYFDGLPFIVKLTGGHYVFVGNFAGCKYYQDSCTLEDFYENTSHVSGLLAGLKDIAIVGGYVIGVTDSEIRLFGIKRLLGKNGNFLNFKIDYLRGVTHATEMFYAVTGTGEEMFLLERKEGEDFLSVREITAPSIEYSRIKLTKLNGDVILRAYENLVCLLSGNLLSVFKVSDDKKIFLLYQTELTEFTNVSTKWIEMKGDKIFVSAWEKKSVSDILGKYKDINVKISDAVTTVTDLINETDDFKVYKLKFCEYLLNDTEIKRVGCLANCDQFFYPVRYGNTKECLCDKIYVNAGILATRPLFSLLDGNHVIFPGLSYMKLPDIWFDTQIKIKGYLYGISFSEDDFSDSNCKFRFGGMPVFYLQSAPLVFKVK